MRALIVRGLIAAALAGAVLTAVATSAPAQPAAHHPTASHFQISGKAIATSWWRSGVGNWSGTGKSKPWNKWTKMPGPSFSIPPSCSFCTQVSVPMASGPGLGIGLGLTGLIGAATTAFYLRRRHRRTSA